MLSGGKVGLWRGQQGEPGLSLFLSVFVCNFLFLRNLFPN